MLNLREIEPTFDAQGYPSDETLCLLETAAPSSAADWPTAADAACAFMARAWRRGTSYYQRRPDGVWVFGTGGWSGNETLIGAFRQSLLYLGWIGHHVIVLTGELYLIPVTPQGCEVMETLKRVITDWACGRIPTDALMALVSRCD